jgi:hypothetical protein
MWKKEIPKEPVNAMLVKVPGIGTIFFRDKILDYNIRGQNWTRSLDSWRRESLVWVLVFPSFFYKPVLVSLMCLHAHGLTLFGLKGPEANVGLFGLNVPSRTDSQARRRPTWANFRFCPTSISSSKVDCTDVRINELFDVRSWTRFFYVPRFTTITSSSNIISRDY